MKESIRKNFRHATLNFLFIILFVNVFQMIFGIENSIVGVIFTILMSASMVRDLTAVPIRHLLIQSLVLILMTVAACLVSSASPWIALPVNAAVIFLILYSFTYEYTNHLYFPYILSYLFLVFISPVSFQQLPRRLLGVLAGVVCIMLYQLVNGRRRATDTAQSVLSRLIDSAQDWISLTLEGRQAPEDPAGLRAQLCRLSQILYDRRKKVLCISDAGFAILDAGRGLENLTLLLYELQESNCGERRALLQELSVQLSSYRAFITGQSSELPSPQRKSLGPSGSAETDQLYQCLLYIREHLLKATLPEKRRSYPKTLLSVAIQLKAALRLSPVRCIYALRVSCLLALCTLLVQLLNLPHGKWLLFTVASVSLPYADDVSSKARKRMIATLLGGFCAVVLYAVIPSSVGRTAIMMISGYLSFYFTDYLGTFACSTLGALGGAVFVSSFGWASVGGMLLVRLIYIGAGILIALLFNCLLFPYRRREATIHLWKKYERTSELLSRICRTSPVDTQLYYNLVIQAHLLEDALVRNATALHWFGAQERLEQCRQRVRRAHRQQPAVL